MALVAQLKSKRVFRAVVGYGVVAFALLQIIEPLMHGLHLPDATLTWLLVALAVAFPLVVAGAWVSGEAEAPAHIQPAWIAAAGLALLAVALGLWLSWRRAAPAASPTLSQITFEGGIEEYPAFSPDGKQIAYAGQSGRVRKIFRKDLASGKVAQLTHGDADDLAPAFSPDGTRLLFMRSHDAVQKLQPSDVFGAFLDADVWQLDLHSGKESLLVANAFNPAWAPGGARIAVDASWAGPRRIWVLDGNGQNPQQATTDSSEEVFHVAPRFSPDGRKIAFQSLERTKFDVRVVNLDSKQQTALTDDFILDIRPVWSPTGSSVYFSSERGGGLNIWRAPVDAAGALSGPLHQVTTGAGQDVEAAFSADGRLLAFTTLHQNADVWRLPVSPETGLPTGAPEPVISTTREDSRGAWSPDGRAIAFNSDRAGEMNIWIHSLADGSDRALTSGPGGDFQPNWSPDGKRVAFFSSRQGRPRIFVADVAGGTLTALTSGASIDMNPFFSPDGKWIAYQSDRSGRAEIWVVPSTGGEPRQLSHEGASGHFARWTDAGDAVVFTCRCSGKRAEMAAPLAGGDPVKVAEIAAGAHISFSPDRKRIMDVVGHRVLTVFPMSGGAEKVFEFPDPTARIDYPVWSPDGKWVLFDRTHPEGGDVWVLRGAE